MLYLTIPGVLAILGLTLAPVTARVSLAVSAAGLGLGAAAAVTSVSTSIVEKVSIISAEAEASQRVTNSKGTVKAIEEDCGEEQNRAFFLNGEFLPEPESHQEEH